MSSLKNKIFFSTICIVAISPLLYLFFMQEAQSVVPSDFGLVEGDLISAVGSSDPDIYIVNEYGYKRLFLNPTLFNFYGHLKWENVRNVSAATRDAFPTSGLFRNCEANDPKVYGVEVTAEDAGMFHWVNVTAEQALAEDADFFKKVFCINNSEFNWYPKGVAYTLVSQVPSYERSTPIKLPTGKVGMAIQFTPFDQDKLIFLLKEGGVQVFHDGWLEWGEIEKSEGVYDFSSFEPTFQLINHPQFDFEVAIDIGGLIALSSDQPSLPTYIQFKGFHDPYLKTRYLAYLDAFLERYSNKLNYLLLHTEGAATYFTDHHPEQLNDYCTLINEAMKHVKQKAANIKVGNNGGGEAGESEKTEIVKCFTREADFVGTGAYPDNNSIYKTPEDVEIVIDNLVRIYSPKKLVLEIGYPSSHKLDSSEQKQEQFVRSLFKTLRKHKDKIEYLGYVELADQNKEVYGNAIRSQFPPDVDQQFLENLIEFVTSLGLFRENGQPKPAWKEFNNQTQLYYQSLR